MEIILVLRYNSFGKYERKIHMDINELKKELINYQNRVKDLWRLL